MLNLAWLTPEANQWFRETTYAMLRPEAPVTSASVSARGHAEYTITDLIAEARVHGPAGTRAHRHLHARAAILLMVPVAMLICVQARRFTASRRWRYGGGGLAWMVMASGYMVATVAGAVVYDWLLQHSYVVVADVVALYRPWLAPMTCAGMALVLAWFAHRAEPRREQARPVFF